MVKIPIQVKGDYNLTPAEKDCIAWYILSGCSPADAFCIFCRPELKVNKMILKKVSSEFFGSVEVQSYMSAYKAELEQTLSQKEKEEEAPEVTQKKKERALRKLMAYVIDQANHIESVEDKESIVKLADKLGLLDIDEERVEAPRRYLPETCSNCRYRKFIEENCIEK